MLLYTHRECIGCQSDTGTIDKDNNMDNNNNNNNATGTEVDNLNQLNCERCGDRLKAYCASCFTGFCDGCWEEIEELIFERDTQKAALSWLDDTVDLHNADDSLAYAVLTNILDGRAASPDFVKHAADWLSDACDLSDEYDALAYDFFSELLN